MMTDKRIPVLDIARGAAILGTLGTNIWLFAYLGNYDFLLGDLAGMMFTWDMFVESVFVFFMNGKFLGLLTILFGMGLEIKRRSYIRNGEERLWPWLYLWGMMLLFIDGYLHYLLVFEFDVLMSYAVTGVIVAFLLTRKRGFIKGVAITLGVIHLIGVLLMAGAMELIFRIEELREEFVAEMQAMSAVYLNGTYFEQVAFRFSDFWAMRAEAIAIIPMNILLFLFGVYLIRSNVFAQTEDARQRRKKMLLWGLGVGTLLNLVTFLPTYSGGIVARYAFAPLMALGYLMAFYWLWEKRGNGFLFRRLSEVGRTALSCYMLQNIVASAIFYGWGLGLGGQLNSVEVIGVWTLICIGMMVFAHLWLKKFSTGPFELVWRWLTRLPVRRKEERKAA
ncbi:hypothetical protein CR205_11480 [Alteribacter lacisalsi]|uniref:DUF418 domain-containing protein n=1 Tax=Alteribacter lacisalsi TaxID=2045244 RepID=A0A2W0H3E5_9BACI|nr:DUF418 domain-containing protein [Alteribacter lacisalsi]PYZ96344.1 hypothetical protein CR205_11480 [Alteribacter lacisalsi]